MPSKREARRKKEHERYLERKQKRNTENMDVEVNEHEKSLERVSVNGSEGNECDLESLTGSSENEQTAVQSESENVLGHLHENGIHSEAPMPLVQSDSSNITKNRRGRPRKRTGRPRISLTPSNATSRSVSPLSVGSSAQMTPLPRRANKRLAAAQQTGFTPKMSRMFMTSPSTSSNQRPNTHFPSFELDLPAEAHPNAQICAHTRMVIEHVRQVSIIPDSFLDEGSIYGFLAYLSTLALRPSVVISPNYTSNYQAFQVPPNARDLCFNYSDQWELMLLPINHPGHFTLLIYERNENRAIFYNSLPHMEIGGANDQFILNAKQAIIDFLPEMAHEDINFEHANPRNFNRQNDGWSCGFHVCLIAEAYMMNFGNTFLDNLNIHQEKRRILWHVGQLFLTDHPEYHPREARELRAGTPIPFGAQSMVDDEHPRDDTGVFFNFDMPWDNEPDPPPMEPTRRSERIRVRNESIAPIVPIQQTVRSKAPSFNTRCHLRHKDIACADIRAEHFDIEYYHSGKLGDVICEYCKARLFLSELRQGQRTTTSSCCCQCGKVMLTPYSAHPDLLLNLSLGNTPEAKEFQKHQNVYNSLMAFASITVGHQESTLNAMNGGVCYMLNGEFTRQISSLFPGQHAPSFSQLYILDPNTALEHRVQNFRSGGDRVNAKTLEDLDTLLRDVHPLAHQYRNFHDQYQRKLTEEGPDAVRNFRLTLLDARNAPQNITDQSLHSRQVNLPQDPQSLFAVWAESEEPPVCHGIWITDAEGRLNEIRPYHPLTDTLCYPILFPRGDDSFHKNIPLVQRTSTRASSAQRTTNLEVEDLDEEREEMELESNDGIQSETRSIAGTSDGSQDDYGEPKKRTTATVRDYIRYRMAIREGEDFHNIWNAGGGISQKFILDYAARIDSDVASFLRTPDMNMRASLPDHIIRWLARNANVQNPEDIGSVVMFRKYHPGTRPYFQKMFYDATTIMARVRIRGRASFMFTFTCNPRWPEIGENLFHKDQKIVDRFDILCRVYEDKLRKIHQMLDKKNIFGKILGYAESREFQKRIGGPHLHRVFCTGMLAIPENIDNLIWAHIPKDENPNDQSDYAKFIRKIRELIPKYQYHDCAAHCLNARGRCKKGFPKPFCNFTVLHDDKPAQYRRPNQVDGGEVLMITRGNHTKIYDNSRVVPYNPFILVMFESHHNLEYAYGQSDNLKYALKYPFKGPSFSYVQCRVNDRDVVNVDEPAQYAKMLFRSPAEAYSRIQSYKYAFLSHTVIDLHIHLPGKQMEYLHGNAEEREAQAERIAQGERRKTELMAYWDQWRNDSQMDKNLLFEQVPEKYAYIRQGKYWKKRKFAVNQERSKRKLIMGRILPVSPRDAERFALYILMKHFPGDCENLLDVNGHTCDTFGESARLRGLIEDNEVWERTLQEGANCLNPSQMRQLFANILVFGGTENCVIDGAMLWERFKDQMYDRRCSDAERPGRIDRALAVLERLLMAQGRMITDFGLPQPTHSLANDPNRAIDEFFFPGHLADDDMDETVDTSAFQQNNLNDEQKQFFDMVRTAVLSRPNCTAIQRLFRLYGDGGTGKTFLLNNILYQLRHIGKKALATASTGIASTKYYSGGMTVHSAFRMGINNEPGKIPQVPLDSFYGRRIIECDLLFIDEITMLDKTILENVDLLCRTMVPSRKDIPFAGKVVVISGDWKQSLPVVGDSYCMEEQLASSVQSSQLYPLFQSFRLRQNMRVQPGQQEFLDWLQAIGTGQVEQVAIPSEMLVENRDELKEFVFGDDFDIPAYQLLSRLQLGITNAVVDINNALILSYFETPEMDYFSNDRPLSDNPLAVNAADYDVAQLNTLTPTGMPAHRIHLRVGCIIVLLLNLNTTRSLCNGTRLIVRQLTRELIVAETITGSPSNRGQIIGISKVNNTYKDKRPDGVSFTRFQFPVRVAFTMTVTKAQGQTCQRLGIDFTEDPFAHGQLYTALSRCTSRDAIRVYAPNKPKDSEGNVYIRNVVCKSVRFD